MGKKIKAGLAGAAAVVLIVGAFTGCGTQSDASRETESTGEVSMITESNTSSDKNQETDTTNQSHTTAVGTAGETSTARGTQTTGTATTTTKPRDTSSIQQDIVFIEIIDKETAWLTSLQLENGALPMTYV